MKMQYHQRGQQLAVYSTRFKLVIKFVFRQSLNFSTYNKLLLVAAKSLIFTKQKQLLIVPEGFSSNSRSDICISLCKDPSFFKVPNTKDTSASLASFLNVKCSPWVVNPQPLFTAAACYHADQTIFSKVIFHTLGHSFEALAPTISR